MNYSVIGRYEETNIRLTMQGSRVVLKKIWNGFAPIALLVGMCLVPQGNWIAASEIVLQASPESTPQRIRYSLQLQGKLQEETSVGLKSWDLKSQADLDFVQRVFPNAAGSSEFRAVRQFSSAQVERTVAGERVPVLTLPKQSQLIQMYGRGIQLIPVSPNVRLTQDQISLLQLSCDPLAATGLLPSRPLQNESEKWNTAEWVIPMMQGVDAVISQSAVCSLQSLNEQEAVIAFEGEAKGAITGSASEMTIRGSLTFDRGAGRIRSFRATLHEKRSIGTVSPGLDATAEITWTQADASETEVPESIPDEFPSDRQLLLTLTTPWRLLLLHDRNWYVYRQTPGVVMLRMVHNGSLVGQCNIAAGPQKPAGSHTSEDVYLSEVEDRVVERKGVIRQSKVFTTESGWRTHHIQATGKVAPALTSETGASGSTAAAPAETVIWDYYLCTASTGEQFSIVFSHTESDGIAFGTADEQIIGSLTIRSARPKVALPR